jgi:xylulokinase
MGHLLGIDLGTSSVKALLYDEKGKVVGRFGQTYETRRSHPHWAEQDPNEWWSTVGAVLRAVTGFRIDAVGLTGQMHGPVFIGPDGQPLHPCIIWADTRARRETLALKRQLSGATILSATGNPASEAFTAPKILWIKKNRPHVFQRAHKILLPKDFIGLKLTGEFATDHSDASGTLLYDIQGGAWSDEIITELDIKRSLLPDILNSATVLGRVTPTAARQTGLVAGIPVVVGAGDLATAATGGGVWGEKVPLVNIGHRTPEFL